MHAYIYVYIYTCLYTYIYIYINVCGHVYICIYVRVFVHMHMYTFIYRYMYVCACVCIYIYMFICVFCVHATHAHFPFCYFVFCFFLNSVDLETSSIPCLRPSSHICTYICTCAHPRTLSHAAHTFPFIHFPFHCLVSCFFCIGSLDKKTARAKAFWLSFSRPLIHVYLFVRMHMPSTHTSPFFALSSVFCFFGSVDKERARAKAILLYLSCSLIYVHVCVCMPSIRERNKERETEGEIVCVRDGERESLLIIYLCVCTLVCVYALHPHFPSCLFSLTLTYSVSHSLPLSFALVLFFSHTLSFAPVFSHTRSPRQEHNAQTIWEQLKICLE